MSEFRTYSIRRDKNRNKIGDRHHILYTSKETGESKIFKVKFDMVSNTFSFPFKDIPTLACPIYGRNFDCEIINEI